MIAHRSISFSGMALAASLLAAQHANAQELIFGSWTPAREYQNAQVMPDLFKTIEKETNGQIKWKLVPGGQLADGKTTFTAVKDGLIQGGLAVPTYVPNTVPALFIIYSTVIVGHNDVIATSAAAMETVYFNCPDCLDEVRKLNAVPLGGWTTPAYVLACREPVKSLADLKGKRVRATGGNAEMFKLAGAVPVGATLVEAVSLLQRGGLDCQHGIADWLRTFGYADFAKYVTDAPLGITGPAIGMFLNRDTWNKFTPEQKRLHMKQAAWMSAKMMIGNFIISEEQGLQTVIKDKGVQMIKPDADFEKVTSEYKKGERARNIEVGKNFGLKDPGAIIDAYEKNVEKWRKLSGTVGRDIDKLADLLDKEIYSKVDLSKL
ncbi:C4-dicarboxylate TRAP transporter substrate-binding protein [Pseudorhodoplanes sinuspersici]|nr:C4-dicarboxylate TRAP transporter substrate-binding protein [Pseudorhodoplanes sinuspersici]RKE72483.1 TRAP-type C4-dicarboxylate transport system substrate-binding protein [Pseudorhodoplanes sinuspersici]